MAGTLVWLRRDLRLSDQPALFAAAARDLPVYPVFIDAPEEEAPWAPGAASRWWLHHSLSALAARLAASGSPLILRKGPSLPTLRALIRETGADAVYWNRCYEPAAIARDSMVKQALRDDGVTCTSHSATLLREPWTIATGSGDPYKVFTPFWKACKAAGIESEPLPLPRSLSNAEYSASATQRTSLFRMAGLESESESTPASAAASAAIAQSTATTPEPHWPASLSVVELDLLPKIPWAGGLEATWTPGEVGAQQRLQAFLEQGLPHYHGGRDLPGQSFTSRLSPHLHFGEISPRQILWELRHSGISWDSGNAEHFVRELGWREFAYHLLYHYPNTVSEPLNPRFAQFPWRTAPEDLRAWQRGQTGIPIVDAGMRELWQTGWMHNRVRMIVGSLLTKNLRLHWLEGARWFWDTLVDADLASNTLGWQWIAGSGADAAPYFRIFNPVLQGQRFDADGTYVRRYVPELAQLPNTALHAPWQAKRTGAASSRTSSDSVPLALSPETAGSNSVPMALSNVSSAEQRVYPSPIIDLAVSRNEALAAYQEIRSA